MPHWFFKFSSEYSFWTSIDFTCELVQKRFVFPFLEVLINSSLSEDRGSTALLYLQLTRIQFGHLCSLILGYGLFFVNYHFCLLPFICSSSVLAPAKDNIGRRGQQEILPHLVLVRSINMRNWLYGESTCAPTPVPPPCALQTPSAFSQLFLSVSASGTARSRCLLPLPQYGKGGKWFTLIRRTKIDKVKFANTAH